MNEARPRNSQNAAPFLICRSGSYWCALALASVVETMRPLPFKPFAEMPPFVLGVSVIRGAPVPIIDAARLLGATTPLPPQRVVTLKVGERRVGLAVDAVLDVRTLPTTLLGEIPPLLRQVGDEVVSAITALDAQLLLVLESARVVPDSVWEAVDSRGERS